MFFKSIRPVRAPAAPSGHILDLEIPQHIDAAKLSAQIRVMLEDPAFFIAAPPTAPTATSTPAEAANTSTAAVLVPFAPSTRAKFNLQSPF